MLNSLLGYLPDDLFVLTKPMRASKRCDFNKGKCT
jgi:hypothetical protein